MMPLAETLANIIRRDDPSKSGDDYAWDVVAGRGAVERVKAQIAATGAAAVESVDAIAGEPPAEGRKDDKGKKCRPGLIAPELIFGIGCVLAFGAKKYNDGNWALGMDWSRPIDALDRHWLAWKGGERADPETGFSHLWHMGCCLMFLVVYEVRGIGRDNRVEVGLMKGSKPL